MYNVASIAHCIHYSVNTLYITAPEDISLADSIDCMCDVLIVEELVNVRNKDQQLIPHISEGNDHS